ncbi:hypothetical protein BO94DRAFT_101032 [Aspergillus sclerotioniger CBS 115572]|uniref:Uncharacterized protein n=1 Tax=Aspergillus sclerotioniger CBS 115572 TaxID=1450535 RepID=A0A317WFM5_9EURO|nr:hypothetical protein BO94DRAFT_101032 [Aspergillus sclerotioniger CBS 115572]PWY84501.1 hypothetical protein BO94DRAFT_101032 [Aspergillus sclerotioniger CBS 115572]
MRGGAPSGPISGLRQDHWTPSTFFPGVVPLFTSCFLAKSRTFLSTAAFKPLTSRISLVSHSLSLPLYSSLALSLPSLPFSFRVFASVVSLFLKTRDQHSGRRNLADLVFENVQYRLSDVASTADTGKQGLSEHSVVSVI